MAIPKTVLPGTIAVYREGQRVIELKTRRCKNCRGVFTPKRMQERLAKFCSPGCRKHFWSYGSLPFDKMMERIRREFPQIVRQMVIPDALIETRKTPLTEAGIEE
jgi:hypothetical protein